MALSLYSTSGTGITPGTRQRRGVMCARVCVCVCVCVFVGHFEAPPPPPPSPLSLSPCVRVCVCVCVCDTHPPSHHLVSASSPIHPLHVAFHSLFFFSSLYFLFVSTAAEFCRACKAASGVELSDNIVSFIFHMFDKDGASHCCAWGLCCSCACVRACVCMHVRVRVCVCSLCVLSVCLSVSCLCFCLCLPHSTPPTSPAPLPSNSRAL